MPKVVDKEEIRQEIMEAFHRLSMVKPLTAISLREIAVEAGLSHSSILRYFHNKNSLLAACVQWATKSFQENIQDWFTAHHLADYDSRLEYMDAYYLYFQNAQACRISAQDVVMACALSAYSEELKAEISAGFVAVNQLIRACLTKEFDREVTEAETLSFCVIFYGIYFSQFSEAIPKGNVCTPVKDLETLLK